tara:strand:- start:800 stop:1564 length:765 start_codon:yes stop_codon:yes gene_type:complete
MVRSENFSALIGEMVGRDRESVISFMRSQGINIGFGSSNNQVIESLFSAFKSAKFRDAFVSWARGMAEGGSSNIGGSDSYASGNFDPMATQSGGFSPIDTQNGANLKGDRFSNASGNFDPMETQSGGFSPIDTQNGANLKGERFSNSDGGSKFWDGFGADDIGGIFTSGLNFWGQKETADAQSDIANAKLQAERVRLEQMKLSGEISEKELQARLDLARIDANAPQSSVILWVVGGVVLVGALGTAIYFATRKK